MSSHPGGALRSWPEARQLAAEIASPVRPTRVPLAEAEGATLAEPLRALTALPGYDAAAMDGYAVAGAGPWRVVDRVFAGRGRPVEALGAGTAVEVSTGAEVPPGAGAVLPYEQTEMDAGLVVGAIEPGRHIRRRDETCALGEELLPAGNVARPAVLGLAASVGYDHLTVRCPRVAMLVTGDELEQAGVPPPGRVRDALGPLLPGLVRWAGGMPAQVTRIQDRGDAMAAAVEAAPADVVVCSGASSVGPTDHLRTVLDTLGANVQVEGVACRPGHPQVLASLPDGRVVVGLPGNPYAALVATLTLVTPLLDGCAGRRAPALERVRLSPDPDPAGHSAGHGAGHGAGGVGRGVVAHPHDTRLLAVRRRGDDGVVPVGYDRPADLRGAALADAIAVVPPGWDGGEVELLPLPDRGHQAG